MPAKVIKKNGLFRVVEADTNITVKNKAEKPVDSGGYQSGAAAEKHAVAINRAAG